MKPYVFGVDVGGTTVKLGLFSSGGDLLEKWEIPTDIRNAGEAILPDVVRSIRETMERRGICEEQVEGIVEGHIATSMSGSEGFGYDPLFIPEGYDISFAEMSADQKNAISHRGRAVEALKGVIKR